MPAPAYVTVVSLMISIVTAGAQVRVVRYGDDRLRGIDMVDLLVEHDSLEAHGCQIDRELLHRSGLEALKAAGLKATVSERASSWFHTVRATVRTVADGERCATSLTTELVAQVQGIPEADRHSSGNAWGSLLVGELSLLRFSAVVVAARAHHEDRVRAAVRDQAALLAHRIHAANQ